MEASRRAGAAAAPRDQPAPAQTAAAGGALPAGFFRPRVRRELRVAALVLTDLLALFLAGALAYLLWALPVRDQRPGLYLPLAPLLLLFVAGYAQAGLYPGLGLGPVERLRRTTYVTGFLFLVLGTYSFVLKAPHLYSRVTFALALLLALVLVPAARSLATRLLRHRSWWPEPVLAVGDPAAVAAAVKAFDGSPELHYRLVGALALEPAGGGAGGDPPSLARAAELAAVGGVRVVVVAGEVESDLLHQLQMLFRHVIVLRVDGGLPVEGLQVRTFGGVVGVEATNNLLHLRNRAVKRTLDLALASVCLLIALPAIALALLAVVLVSPGSPLFVQRRAGLGGRPIPIPKIRTMYPDAEERLAEHLATDPRLAREWDRHHKLRDDPRLLAGVGRLLRRWSLDELPQLWSVMKGDMSLVGPRPLPEYHLARFSARFRDLRQRVRPGITGLWQVTTRSEGGVVEQQASDSHYIRNWSLWLDLYILGRTLGAVLGGKGAY